MKLSTMAEGRITKLPYIGEPSTDTRKTHEVFVTAIPDQIPKPDVVPLWIFVLAACAGALILLLLIYLLYKVSLPCFGKLSYIYTYFCSADSLSVTVQLEHHMKDSHSIETETITETSIYKREKAKRCRCVIK